MKTPSNIEVFFILVAGVIVVLTTYNSRLSREKEFEKNTLATSPIASRLTTDVYLLSSVHSKVYHLKGCVFARCIKDEYVLALTKSQFNSSGRRPCRTCRP
jgi:hypothetical protein